MKVRDFWDLVTHQASRPPTPKLIAEAVEAARTEAMCDTAGGHAMMAACHYYGWETGGKPDHALAFAHATAAADRGDPWGHFYVGVCLHQGHGVETDYRASAEHMIKAVNANIPLALYDLGLCLMRGEGIPPNMHRAYSLFQRAAKLELALAFFILGYCHETGAGCTMDLDEAERLHQQALEMGLEQSRPRLAAIREYKARLSE